MAHVKTSSVKTGIGHTQISTQPSSPDDLSTQIPSLDDYEGPTKSWHPWTLRLPALISFIVLCLALIAALELLWREASNLGAIFGVNQWVFELAPTIVMVMLGVYWSIIQNDVVRLEPYYQLSKPDGATAHQSLLLDYQRVWHFLIPFVAWKKKHWAVAVSTLILMLVTLGATPLSAAVFSATEKPVPEELTGKLASLVPMEEQINKLSAQFSYNAYEHVWNHQSLPEFAEEEYSIRPFEMNDEFSVPTDLTNLGGVTYEFATTKYSVEVGCVEPKQEIAFNSTTKKPSRVWLTYGEGTDQCEYPLWTEYLHNGYGWYNLDKELFGHYPYNAILQDISAKPENYRMVFGLNELTPDVYGVKNTTKICGLQDEFEFMTFIKPWEVEKKDIDHEGTLPWQRVAQLLPDFTTSGSRVLPNGTVVAPDFPKDLPKVSHPIIRPGNFIAAFCKPVYHQQEVNAVVNAETRNIVSFKARGDRMPLENVNTTLFKDILTARHRNFTSALGIAQVDRFLNKEEGAQDIETGISVANITLPDGSVLSMAETSYYARMASFSAFGMPDHGNQMRFSDKFQGNVTLAARLFNLNPSILYNAYITPRQSLMPFVMAISAGVMDSKEQDDASSGVPGLSKLENFDGLHKALDKTYSMLFSYAMRNGSFFMSPGENAATVPITRHTITVGTGVSTLFTRLTQGVLALAAILAVVMIFVTRGRTLNTNEPGAIIWHMKSVANCPELMEELRGMEQLSAEQAYQKLKADKESRYFLNAKTGGVEAIRPFDGPQVPSKSTDTSEEVEEYPVDLSPWLGLFAMAGFAGICTAIGMAVHFDKKDLGFVIPRKAVASIVFSYIPTILATFVDAYVVMLEKFLALVAPYDDMHRRRTSIRTLFINYERTSPFFLWIQAFKNGHFLLAAFSVSVICTNVLAVAFSGMFKEEVVIVYQNTTINSTITLSDSVTDNFNTTAVRVLINMDYEEQNLTAFRTAEDAETRRVDFPDLEDDEWDAYKRSHNFLKMEEVLNPYSNDPMDNLEIFYAGNSGAGNTGWRRPWTDNGTFYFPLDLEPLDDYKNVTAINGRTLGIRTQVQCTPISKDQLIVGERFSSRVPGSPRYVFPGLSKESPCEGAVYHKSSFFDSSAPTLKVGPDYYTTIQPVLREGCRGNFYALWEKRVPTIENPNTEGHTNSTLIVSCVASFEINQYTVTFNQNGNVQNATAEPFSKNLLDITKQASIDDLQLMFQTAMGPSQEYEWQDDGFQTSPAPPRWFSLHLENHSPALKDSWPPDADVARVALEEVYTELFTAFLSVVYPALLPATPSLTNVSIAERQLRWRIVWPAVCIAVVILAFFFVLVAVVIVRKPGWFMQHLPSSIAGSMVVVYAGKWVKEMMERKGGRWEEEEVRFGYGLFVGYDGKEHVGVDREPVERWEGGRRKI